MINPEYQNFLDGLGRVEKLSTRDLLIMDHAYQIGFRHGVEKIDDILTKENNGGL